MTQLNRERNIYIAFLAIVCFFQSSSSREITAEFTFSKVFVWINIFVTVISLVVKLKVHIELIFMSF
jgi:hypothetical protein